MMVTLVIYEDHISIEGGSGDQVRSNISTMHFVVVIALMNTMLVDMIVIVKRMLIKCYFEFMVMLVYYCLY